MAETGESIGSVIVLILLPPSESKARGGTLPPVDFDSLLFPELAGPRTRVAAAVTRLARDLPASRAALKVTAAKDDEIAANAVIRTAECLPALDRYTGVLFDALGPSHFTALQRSRAEQRIVIASALFGAVRAGDRIPSYRLSATSRLPGLGSLAALWKPCLAPSLASLATPDSPLLDLRSGAYAALARVPGAITVRVVTERPDGSRAVVSHFNKATKGRLARILATYRGRLAGIDDVIRCATRSGVRVEHTAPTALTVIT